MDKFLHILIQRPDKVKAGCFKELYRNSIVYEDAVTIPFYDLVKAFNILYPYKDLIINFSIHS